MVLGMEVCTAKNSYGSKYSKIRFVWFNKDVCLVIVHVIYVHLYFNQTVFRTKAVVIKSHHQTGLWHIWSLI